MLARRCLLQPVRDSLTPELEDLWKQGIYTDFIEAIRSRTEAHQFHSLYLDISQEATLLYDRDQFLYAILKKIRERLQSAGAERRPAGRYRYWDLKQAGSIRRGCVTVNLDESTKRMISRALIIDEAEYLQGKQAWNMAVRRSQEVVELALKAALLRA